MLSATCSGANKITEVPSEVFYSLSNLKELQLYKNKIAVIPPEIGQLSGGGPQAAIPREDDMKRYASNTSGSCLFINLGGNSLNSLHNLPIFSFRPIIRQFTPSFTY